MRLSSFTVVGLAAVLLSTACTSVAPGSGASSGNESPSAPKRAVAAMMGNPPTMVEKIIGGGSGGRIPGINGLEQMVDPGLTMLNDKGNRLPILVEQVPSVENGLWKLNPDGSMETTWKIRSDAKWHDGAPLTADDLVFTTRVDQDKDLPVERLLAYTVVSVIEAPDPRTLRVLWKSPFIEADAFLERSPLPKHVLEKSYVEAKETFAGLPYWNRDFVGTGAYRVKEWVTDSHVVLDAFDLYALGRPKIDQIVVQFIDDENAFVATILAGGIDVTLAKSITLEQARSLREQWTQGHIEVVPENSMKIWPQFINANPAVVTNVQFRKALMYGMNRQEMVDAVSGGLATEAHTVLLPIDREFPEIEAGLIKYEYDPRRATEVIQALGYSKGSDGVFIDPSGQRLAVEISSTNEDQNTKPMFAVSDYWRRLGVGVESVVIPIQRQRDREYRATFPGFNLQGGASGVGAIKNSHGSQARLPENDYTGSNYSRYINPEFDGLIDRYLTTIAWDQRMEALRAVVHHMGDSLNMLNLYYAMSSTMISNRMLNVGVSPTWNAHAWDVKG